MPDEKQKSRGQRRNLNLFQECEREREREAKERESQLIQYVLVLQHTDLALSCRFEPNRSPGPMHVPMAQ